MALMQIKNKYAISFTRLIKGTEKEGGIPDYITIEPLEAWDILKEMNAIGKQGSPFTVTRSSDAPHDSTQFEIASRVWNNPTEIDRDEANRIILQWMRGEFGISVHDIPLKVVRSKQPEKAEKAERTWWQRLTNK